MELYEKNGNILYILNVLKKYSDEEHILAIKEFQDKIQEEYGVYIEKRTIRRNVNLLKEKFGYDIITYNDNNKGYYIINNPETDFEYGEIRAIIDIFSYSTFIEKRIAKGIIEKCKNLQNIYQNEKMRNYKVYSPKGKTTNVEVIKNIEDIADSIMNKNKVKLEYWKYCIVGDKIEKQMVSTPVVSPYAILYDKEQLYMLGIKEGESEFFHYRLDRIKNIKQLKDPIKIQKTEEEIEKYVKTSVEIFSGNEIAIEADSNKILLEEVIEKFGNNNVEIKPINKDTFNMKLKVNPQGFKLWAMRNIDLVTVKSPENLVKEIKELIEESLRKYN